VKKPMMIASGGLAVAGLFVGIGYVMWCLFLSGSAAGEHEITVGRPVKLALTSEMNPVAFNVKARWGGSTIRIGGRGKGTSRRRSYRAKLTRAGAEVWSERFSFSSESDNGTGTTSVRVFDVPPGGDGGGDGEYEFVVTGDSSTAGMGLNVSSLTLKLRRNVTRVNWSVAGPGIGAFVLGIIGLVISGRRKAEGAGKGAPEQEGRLAAPCPPACRVV